MYSGFSPIEEVDVPPLLAPPPSLTCMLDFFRFLEPVVIISPIGGERILSSLIRLFGLSEIMAVPTMFVMEVAGEYSNIVFNCSICSTEARAPSYCSARTKLLYSRTLSTSPGLMPRLWPLYRTLRVGIVLDPNDCRLNSFMALLRLTSRTPL